jgi:hypothetical protein
MILFVLRRLLERRPLGGLGLLPCRHLPLGAIPSQGRVPRDQQPRGSSQAPGAIAQAETQTQVPSRF